MVITSTETEFDMNTFLPSTQYLPIILAAIIAVIISAFLATLIFGLVQISIRKHHRKFIHRGAVSAASLAEEQEDEQGVIQQNCIRKDETSSSTDEKREHCVLKDKAISSVKEKRENLQDEKVISSIEEKQEHEAEDRQQEHMQVDRGALSVEEKHEENENSVEEQHENCVQEEKDVNGCVPEDSQPIDVRRDSDWQEVQLKSPRESIATK